MNRMRRWRLPLAVIFVAATMLLAGGLAVGSNMGFKLNKPLVLGGAGQIGNNLTSIPYNNPYNGDLAAFCAQTGLPGATILEKLVDSTIDPNNCGAFQTGSCAIPPAGGPLLPGRGLRIRPLAGTGAPSSIIIVGSHNPATVIPACKVGAGQVGNVLFAVPYHTTAVNGQDLCTQAGMVNGTGVVESLNATTGVFTTRICGNFADQVVLVLGEAVRIKQPPNGVSFIPAHF